jgi:aromatic-L-amino-acid/L-tryptophan decarboxylase
MRFFPVTLCVHEMAHHFDLTRDDLRQALDWLVGYFETLPERPVLVPTTSAALRAILDEPLPRSGRDFSELLSAFDDVIVRYVRHNGHPRFFGYISSPSSSLNAAGGLLEAALNVNVTAWRSAPAAAELEHVTINWMKEMLGYPAEAAGLFTSGGSMASFAALAAARSAKAPGNVVRDGMAGVPAPMCLYVSREGHFSVAKAAGMLGLGEANVREIPTDDSFRIDVAALEQCIEEDRSAGRLPFCIVASAGTTATGAIDPLGKVAAIARRHGLWLHVDAAYGGFAALAPSVRERLAGIEEADSIALDPHKWLYLPVGCGCILYKDRAAARAAFSHGADYTRPIGLERDEAFAFWDYGPELSRPFRALQVWLWVRFAGADALGRAIQGNTSTARNTSNVLSAPAEISRCSLRSNFRSFASGIIRPGSPAIWTGSTNASWSNSSAPAAHIFRTPWFGGGSLCAAAS